MRPAGPARRAGAGGGELLPGKIRAALAQRAAEQTYGVAEEELTRVPWTAPQLEALWRTAHPDRFPWFIAEGLSSRVPKEAARCRASALKNWVASRAGKYKGPKVGFPVWRKRRDGSRFRYDADRAKPADARTVSLPGIGKVATREDMSWLTGRIEAGDARVLGATVKERAGRWWISFQLDVDRTALNASRTAPAGADACGLDLGLTVFATLRNDDGTTEEIQAPKPLKRALRKLARANRALVRKAEGSANRARQARKVAALHLKVAHQRADFLHQTTTWLARTKRAIAVETLHIAGMMKNHRLARAIQDAGWGSSSVSSATRPSGTARICMRSIVGLPPPKPARSANGCIGGWRWPTVSGRVSGAEPFMIGRSTPRPTCSTTCSRCWRRWSWKGARLRPECPPHQLDVARKFPLEET